MSQIKLHQLRGRAERAWNKTIHPSGQWKDWIFLYTPGIFFVSWFAEVRRPTQTFKIAQHNSKPNQIMVRIICIWNWGILSPPHHNDICSFIHIIYICNFIVARLITPCRKIKAESSRRQSHPELGDSESASLSKIIHWMNTLLFTLVLTNLSRIPYSLSNSFLDEYNNNDNICNSIWFLVCIS